MTLHDRKEGLWPGEEAHESAGPPTPGYLFVLPWELSDRQGVNQVVLNLFEQFGEDEKYRPMCHIPSWEEGAPSVERLQGRLTFRHRLPSPWDSRRGLQLFRFGVYLPPAMLAIRRLIDRERVAVVNYHFPDPFALSYTIARWLGLIRVKIILTFHNSDVHAISNVPRWVHWLYRLILREVDAIVAVSDGLRRRILREFPEFASKAHVIYNGVDVERFLAETSLAPAPELPPRYVLSVGALDWRKGHDILLKAFARCATAHPDVSLILLGPRGDASDWLECEVREQGLGDRVLIPGEVSHGIVGRYMEGAEVYVLASRREGFPMSILEAGACGRPVIATAIDGIPEVITHAESGLLIMSEDVDALAENLNFLLTDGIAAHRLGCALRRRLVEDFTWRKVYQNYLALCESLTSVPE